MGARVAHSNRFRSIVQGSLLAALLLAAGPIRAQPPGALSAADIPADQEPVTPVPVAPASDPRIVALGERLFNDPHLSGDGTRACSSCHDVQTNGADSHRYDTTPDGGPTTFHTISVFDSSLGYRTDWEGNARTLEEQAALSLNDPQLMASSDATALRAVKSDADLSRRFEMIYGHMVRAPDLLNAIATYERSLVTPGSRFDLWLAGDKTALSGEEQNGYELFKSFGCISCHQGVDLGGNLFERSGIFHAIGGSQGRLLLVPGLRNVAVMAPYFHNGSAPTLDKAVAEMGLAQLDRHLTDDQVQAVAAFLKTLTGRYDGRQLTPSK
jgi:cytochrome c peroxidase